ncbi:class I SAM-dependent methyltransferase [Candidatus Azambacteria bacterium]|nr:class I SAM-dependent methyltransferase [Candidatus Azambacteria bacterium]
MKNTIIKSTEYFLRSAYRRYKNSFMVGWALRYVEIMSRRPAFRGIILRYFVIPEAVRVVREVCGSAEKAQQYLSELRDMQAMKKKFAIWHAGDFDVAILYLLIRITKPEVVVETGISSGRSSTAILEALVKNGKGTLYSIDFPKIYEGKTPGKYVTVNGKKEFRPFVPPNEEGPGWLIPSELRSRWVRVLGDSRVELPKLAAEVKKIDIFYHDSDHTYETMTFEYETAWPAISSGGFLISDDVRSNDAFEDYVRKIRPAYGHIYNGLGIVMK